MLLQFLLVVVAGRRAFRLFRPAATPPFPALPALLPPRSVVPARLAALEDPVGGPVRLLGAPRVVERRGVARLGRGLELLGLGPLPFQPRELLGGLPRPRLAALPADRDLPRVRDQHPGRRPAP